MPFNPDQFLAETAPKGAGSFDPDKFLADTAPKPAGSIEAAGRGFANNVPLVPQAIAGLSKGDYSTNLEDWNAKAAMAKSEHPAAYGTGAVAGAVAPVFLPVVGEAMEAAPIASNALYGAASAMSNTDVLKHPGEAVKEAAVGAGAGGATAGIVGKLFPSASTLESMSRAKAVENTNMMPAYLGNLSKDEFDNLGRYIKDNGLVGVDKEKLLAHVTAKHAAAGKAIGDVGKELTKRGINATQEDIFYGMNPLLDESEKLLGNKSTGTSAVENNELKRLGRTYAKGASDIMNKVGENPSWDTIQHLKQAYGHAAFDPVSGEVKDKAAAETYFQLRKMQMQLSERAQKHPGLPSEYKAALQEYSTLEPIKEGLTKLVGGERAKGSAGIARTGGFMHRLVATLPGQHNPAINLPTAAAASLISPHFGPLLAIPTLTNPAIQSKVAGSLAKHVPEMSQSTIQGLIQALAGLHHENKDEE